VSAAAKEQLPWNVLLVAQDLWYVVALEDSCETVILTKQGGQCGITGTRVHPTSVKTHEIKRLINLLNALSVSILSYQNLLVNNRSPTSD